MERALYGDELGPGALCGAYVIEALRFEGGCGQVYRARDARTGSPVALKILRAELSASPNALRRFQQEAEAVARLSHPGIVRVLGSGALHDGRPFIAMEWLEGRDLAAELTARGPFTAREALAVAEEVGAALSAAHAAGIVHRDLKAQNVVATPSGAWLSCTLVDFGVAKLTDPEAGGPMTSHTRLGTPGVMAPEQILGQGVDARTDIYAFGALLFRLVTGRLPFLGASRGEVEEQHLSAQPASAADLAPVPEAFARAIARCLQKAPAARYPSVEAMLVDLRAACGTAPTTGPEGDDAVGVYVEASLARPSVEPDDATLDDVEALLGFAREELCRQGFEIALETSSSLLATRAGGGARGCDLARELEVALGTGPGANGRVRPVVSVREAPLPDLLRPSEWVGRPQPTT